MPTEYTLSPHGLAFKRLPDSKKKTGRIKVYFSAMAFAKMALLIDKQAQEVAWHGLVSQKSKHVYIVEDILVYPQAVSDVSIDADQIAYQDWMMRLDSDKFNKLRMHGHSHVNMPTIPSGVDIGLQSKIVAMLEKNMFYIFLIWNKSFKHFVCVFDPNEKRMYFDEEVLIDILSDKSKPLSFTFNKENADKLLGDFHPQLEGFYAEASILIKDSQKTEGSTGNQG